MNGTERRLTEKRVGRTAIYEKRSRRSSDGLVSNRWPKLFHAMRSSRETELAREYPIHVVTAWLGNTPSIALRHYLLTTDEDFEKAAAIPNPTKESSNEPPTDAVQKAVQQGSETARNASKCQCGNSRNAKENGRLREFATCRGGGHGGRTRNP